MVSREVAYALSVRIGQNPSQGPDHAGREVLLEQRPASHTVMPGLWELPALRDSAVPEKELRMTVRHAIMQTNYYVRVRTVFEDDAAAMTVAGGERRWVALNEAARMALTGLTRKVLSRAHLLATAPLDAIAPQMGEDLP
jgi:A/G-specific adenine glycosylase